MVYLPAGISFICAILQMLPIVWTRIKVCIQQAYYKYTMVLVIFATQVIKRKAGIKICALLVSCGQATMLS